MIIQTQLQVTVKFLFKWLQKVLFKFKHIHC